MGLPSGKNSCLFRRRVSLTANPILWLSSQALHAVILKVIDTGTKVKQCVRMETTCCQWGDWGETASPSPYSNLSPTPQSANFHTNPPPPYSNQNNFKTQISNGQKWALRRYIAISPVFGYFLCLDLLVFLFLQVPLPWVVGISPVPGRGGRILWQVWIR